MEVTKMALARPKPKTLTPEQSQQIVAAASQQQPKTAKEKSYDSDYPVFEVPINDKVLIYIPNHRQTNPDGTVRLRADKFTAHPITDGNSFGNVRCLRDLKMPELGYDGSCPLCEGMDDVWNLYKAEYEGVARARGVATDAPEAKELLKTERKDLANSRVIRESEVWMTFPIVVVACEKNGSEPTDTRRPILQDNKLQFQICWYSIREMTYLDKWEKVLNDTVSDDAVAAPAGMWAILNFTYTPKSGKHDKMGSAKSLSVTFLSKPEYAQWAEYFDQLSVGWTPEKAQEVVVLDALRDMEETTEIADRLLKGVRDRLAMYDLGKASALAIPAPTSNSMESALSGFGASPVATQEAAVPGVPSAPPISEMPVGTTGVQ